MNHVNDTAEQVDFASQAQTAHQTVPPIYTDVGTKLKQAHERLRLIEKVLKVYKDANVAQRQAAASQQHDRVELQKTFDTLQRNITAFGLPEASLSPGISSSRHQANIKALRDQDQAYTQRREQVASRQKVLDAQLKALEETEEMIDGLFQIDQQEPDWEESLVRIQRWIESSVA